LKNDGNKNIYLRELHTILRFSALINSSLKIESVLNNAMKWAEEFINAEASSIYELDEDKDELFIRLARGEKKAPVKNIRLKRGEGIAGRVVETGQPMVIHNTSKEKRFDDRFDRITGFHTQSMICVPLLLRGKPIGVIQVLNKKSPEPFNKVDMEILTSMSQQIAVAMENAKLYQRLEEKFELTARELRGTQEKLIRSERLAAMGHLVNGVAHEIRNPIMIIGGFTRRIKVRTHENTDLQRYTDIILSETARLERLVKKVYEFAEVQSASLLSDRLEPVIEKVLSIFEMLFKKQNIEIITSIDDDLPPVKIDSSQMVTALSNIFENAFEAMGENGRVIFRVTRDEENWILIIVKDFGCGISQEELDSIYDPFVTSKTSGAGLGLTMVHQIIMNHHGELKITSQKDEGTTVAIRLPISYELNHKEIEG
jgi:signal transduction histidine kinase